ncbi:MAG: hypothetical protein IT464_12810 [Planctomycetes bacterium]|nr:hypothetical protein [Planctomycetota bacterium]
MAKYKRIRKPPKPKSPPVPTPADEEYWELDFGERVACWECSGQGWVITCCDDMCHGLDYCIHGDGETTCPNCNGTGDEP